MRPSEVPGLHLAHDALEGSRGHVMALVDDHVTVGRDDVVDGPIAHETLEHGHIQHTARLLPATSYGADLLSVHPQEQGELFTPLFQ